MTAPYQIKRQLVTFTCKGKDGKVNVRERYLHQLVVGAQVVKRVYDPSPIAPRHLRELQARLNTHAMLD